MNGNTVILREKENIELKETQKEKFSHMIMASEDGRGVIIAVCSNDKCIRLKNEEQIVNFIRDVLNIRAEQRT